MDYAQSVLTRLLHPGILLLLAGAVLVYASEKLSKAVFHSQEPRTSLTLKVVGALLAVAGAVWFFLT